MEDQDTGFHDHDLSDGAVAVAGGSVREDRLLLGGMSRGGHNAGRAGRAGRGGGIALPTVMPPARQRVASARLSATFSAGSPAARIAAAPSARKSAGFMARAFGFSAVLGEIGYPGMRSTPLPYHPRVWSIVPPDLAG